MKSRQTVKLLDSLDQRLKMYALAAGASGMGLLAVAQSADAKIVYTPTHHVLGRGSSYNLDFNHDGVVDFKIYFVESSGILSLWVRRFGRNQMVGYHDRTANWGSALPSGARVGPGQPFLPESGAMFLGHCSNSCYSIGPWVGVQNRYLGLKFYIKGKLHYGWARLSTTPAHNPRPILKGYAYETVPNRPIITGKTKGPEAITVQPATLGHLARGASAASGLRP